MTDNSVQLGHLADDFTAKIRAGQMPDIEEYAQRHPEIAERIRALFPTLLFLEGMAAAKPMLGNAEAATQAPGGGSTHLAPGSIFNHYRIERELGRGGMGVVYEAVHLPLNKRVALKVLPLFAGQGPSHLERFLREAQTAAGLHHTNIVPVFDIGQADNLPFYAMQFIEGRGLDVVLTDREVEGAREPAHSTEFFEWAAKLGIQAADALAYAHERGVIHRDIKPSNLLLDSQGVLWITDFGLARRAQDPSLTQPGAMVGTPRYMSPEQAEAACRPIDLRTDIYSLGATLYELVTGRPPFSGQTPTEVVLQIIADEPSPPRRLDPAVPRDLETIILKAMAKQPKDRYQTAADLGEDLRHWLKLEPIKARRIGPVGRTVRWCRRNPRLAILSAAAAMVIFSLSSVYYWSLLQENARTQNALEVAQDARMEADKALMNEQEARQATADALENARAAGEQAKDSLARSLYDQARFLRTSRQLARRRLGLERLEEAEKLRGRSRTVPLAKVPASLPTRGELRQEAVATLLLEDPSIALKVETLVGIPAAVTSDGLLAATVRSDAAFRSGEVRLMDLATSKGLTAGDVCKDLGGFPIALRRDGKVLVSQGDAVTLRELPTGKHLSTLVSPIAGRLPSVLGWSFSSDGSYLAAYGADDGLKLVLWDVHDPSKPRAIANAPPSGPANPFHAFSSAGNILAFFSEPDHLNLWEFQAGKKPTAIALPLPANGPLAFGKNDRLLALAGTSSGGGYVLLWDLSRQAEYARLKLDPGAVANAVAFSPDDKRLAVGTRHGVIVIFDVSAAKPVEITSMEPAHEAGIVALRWQRDGKHLVSSGLDGAVKVWELSGQAIRSRLDAGTKEIHGFGYSADGKWLAINGQDRKVRLIKRETAQTAHEWSADAMGAQFVFSADSRRLAVVRQDATMAWDIASGKEVARLQAKGWGNGKISTENQWISGAFGPKGDFVVSGFEDRRLGVWNASGKVVWRNPRGTDATGFGRGHFDLGAHWLAELPDSLAKPVTIWEFPEGRQAFKLPPASSAGGIPTFTPQFSSDSRWLVVGCVGLPQGGIAAWKLPSGEHHLLLTRQPHWFPKYTISPDSRLLVVGNRDGSVEFWDLEKGQKLFTLQMQQDSIDHLAFAPDGPTLATSDARSGVLHLLNLGRLRSELAKIGLDW
jgi:serine/threonine protein kinase/WD40 repeat protein